MKFNETDIYRGGFQIVGQCAGASSSCLFWRAWILCDCQNDIGLSLAMVSVFLTCANAAS